MGLTERFQHPGWVGVIFPLLLGIGSTFTPARVRVIMLMFAVVAGTWFFYNTPYAGRRLLKTFPAAIVFSAIAFGIFLLGRNLDVSSPTTEVKSQSVPQLAPQSNPEQLSKPETRSVKAIPKTKPMKSPEGTNGASTSPSSIQTGPINAGPCSNLQIGGNNNQVVSGNCDSAETANARAEATGLINDLYESLQHLRELEKFWTSQGERPAAAMLPAIYSEFAMDYENKYRARAKNTRQLLISHIRHLPPTRLDVGRVFDSPKPQPAGWPYEPTIDKRDVESQLCNLRQLLNELETENNLELTGGDLRILCLD